jgi:hypothetical protein
LTAKHLVQAIGKDKEINFVLKNFTISQGGRFCQPIHEKLLPGKKIKKDQTADQNQISSQPAAAS